MMAEAQKQLGALEQILAQFNDKTGLKEHRPQASGNLEGDVMGLEITMRQTEMKRELQN